MTKHDPLLAGFYSIASASHLLDMPQRTLRGWLNGYPNSESGAIIERDFSGTRAVSFLDLMELRFVAFFRRQQVSMQTLRKAATRARREWNVSHPLALSSESYFTDRKQIFAVSAEETEDARAWDLATGQHEMWTAIVQSIDIGVVFDPKTHLAAIWRPDPEYFPEIEINPRIAFGKPVVSGTSIPTYVLFTQWKAEGRKDKVAEWYQVPINAVEIAIEYESESN